MPAIGANQRRVPIPPALPPAAVTVTRSRVEDEGALQRVMAVQLESWPSAGCFER